MNDNYLAFLKSIMPDLYFNIMDKEDFESHSHLIEKIIKPENKEKLYHFKGDIEDFYVHRNCKEKLKSTFLKASSSKTGKIMLFRTFYNFEKDFVLTAIYKDPEISERRSEFNVPSNEFMNELFLNEAGKIVHNICTEISDDSTKISVFCINVAFNTLLANLYETLEKHKINSNFISIWQIKKPFTKADKFYQVDIIAPDGVSQNEYMSLAEDFERYIQTAIKPMSIFDMVGPSMVGPSSSHTAGANRIGQISRQIILAVLSRGEKISDIEVKLLGSFRDTGVGHKTPSALGGGLCGFGTDHPDMISNGDPELLTINGIKFDNQTASFNGYKKGTPADDLIYLAQHNNNIAEIIFTTDVKTYVITGFSIGAGNVEIRFFDKELPRPINGKIDMWLNGDDIVCENHKNCQLIKKIYDEAGVSEIPSLPFNTFEELDEYLDDDNKDLIKIICETEYSLQKLSQKEVYEKMQAYWQIMRNSVYSGVKSTEKSLLKLSGGDAKKMADYLKSNSIFDNIYGKAASYSTAVNELNARSGVIIACPTAGSCGIVPGVLTAYCETKNIEEEKILESLMVAGFFGMILFTDVSTAGADYGCQAEIGAAAAMAASAITYLENGTHQQMIQAFVLALKNSLGLICDPVAGLVEVPCVKRNGIYSSLALSSAFMALSGVSSFVSPDEVVLTMREVGERLHIDYKETGRAGLAKTRDGKQVEKDFEVEVRRFFG
jgi:L-serine dehydratase